MLNLRRATLQTLGKKFRHARQPSPIDHLPLLGVDRLSGAFISLAVVGRYIVHRSIARILHTYRIQFEFGARDR